MVSYFLRLVLQADLTDRVANGAQTSTPRISALRVSQQDRGLLTPSSQLPVRFVLCSCNPKYAIRTYG